MTETHEILSDCLDIAGEFGAGVHFDASYLGHLYTVSLYISMLELGSEILRLNNTGPKPGIPIIARSILEAYVEIKNLTEDEEYIGVVEYSWVNSWLKTMKAAQGGNQYVASIAGLDDFEQKIAEQEAALDELKGRGLKHTTIKTKFEKAGMIDEYDTIYGWLSGYSHGGLQALIDRHMEVVEGSGPKVSAFQNRPISEFETSVGTVCQLIVRATDHMNVYLEAGEEDTVAKLKNMVAEHEKQQSPSA